MIPLSSTDVQRTGGLIKHWMQDLIGAGLTVAVGLLALAAHPIASQIAKWSYDSSYSLRPQSQTNTVVLVTLDASSRKNLEQPDDVRWDRQLHAKLLDSLVTRGAKLVVFTTVFSEPSATESSDPLFAQSLRRARGKVVLAGTVTNGTVKAPIPELAGAAPWGLLTTPAGTDDVIRQHGVPGSIPTIAVRASQLLGRPSTNAVAERWFNYGARPELPEVRYEDVLKGTAPVGLLKGKIILIAPPVTDSRLLPTPTTRWTGRRCSQSEIEAIAILNFYRREWLSRFPAAIEATILIVIGALLGLAFMGIRARATVLLALGITVLVAAGASVLVTYVHLWFPWLVVAGVQIPTAIGWAWLCSVIDRGQGPRIKSVSPHPNPNLNLPTTTAPAPPVIDRHGPANSTATDSPSIPDHTLLKCIGRGAYGEVWLARDVFGRHHAVKIVKARNFPHAAPYEREFKGIEHFTPISRTHPGLMQVLHVGRNDAAGYFFYIMDLADDAGGRSPLDPERYTPKTLASELTQRSYFSVRESVEIGLALSAALEHLHQHKLVHRDIKPSNIIFVGGKARIADIGLVAQLDTSAEPRTRLGTEGYLPPEGPGAPTADIYGLGKVLYEISMGRDRWQFPEFPTTLGTRPDQDILRKLHAIILSACETDPTHRYQSAAALHAALAQLQAQS